MLVYSNPDHYQIEHRYFLNNIIKALWNDRSDEERAQVYGSWVKGFAYTPQIENADIALLTYQWNWYFNHDRVAEAIAEITHASCNGKKTLVFSGGDSPANLIHPDVLLFEAGGYRSAQGLHYHSGLPSFLADYLPIYCENEIKLRPWSARPVIGFCGQAGKSPLRTLFRKARSLHKNRQFQRGNLKWQPPPFETTSFRSQVLAKFMNQESVTTNFLLREQYHAGDDHNKGALSSQKLAFVENILNSDYTVCMRGGGNFSVRFYETLCLGRIPVFIDTDCLLPFADKIPYRELFPWIEMKDLPHAADIVANFHKQLGPDGFIERQKACRCLWEEHFTPNGFYRGLQDIILERIKT